jgi:hypothetical protein
MMLICDARLGGVTTYSTAQSKLDAWFGSPLPLNFG